VTETLTPEEQFLTLARAHRNVFLTGQAGTGKSWLLRAFLEGSPKPPGVAVTAPTGIAALNIGGTTVHRWAGMQLGPRPGETFQDCSYRLLSFPGHKHIRDRINSVQTLVIDEISMMSGQHFEFLNFWMQILRESTAPFGGVQLICLGDFLQLPPVRTDACKPYDWVFRTPAWEHAKMTPVRLTTVRRQDEVDLITALSGFRVGRMSGDSVGLMKSRVTQSPGPDVTRLLTHNAQVDRWNEYRLGLVESPLFQLKASTSGPPKSIEFALNNLGSPEVLELKIGATVMFTANDPNLEFANGQIGVVVDYDESDGVVLVESRERLIRVKPFRWRFDTLEVTIKQHPLRLAYAMTIHRAQGLTMDKAYIDITTAREPGQAYVAVSRVRTLEGLHLRGWPNTWVVSGDALRFDSNP
jgi:hypothetical protein